MSTESGFLFTSEPVTEGHPDTVADQVSDAIADAALAAGPGGRLHLGEQRQGGWPAGCRGPDLNLCPERVRVPAPPSAPVILGTAQCD